MTVSLKNMETWESGSVTTVSCGTQAGPLSDKSHKSFPCIRFGKKRVRCTFESGSLKNHCSLLPAGSSSALNANAIPESQLPQTGCLSEGWPAASLPRKFSELLCPGICALILTNGGMLFFCQTINGWPLQTAIDFLSSSCSIWRDAGQQMSGWWRCGTYPQWDFICLCGKVKFAGKWMKLENIILGEVTRDHQRDKNPCGLISRPSFQVT